MRPARADRGSGSGNVKIPIAGRAAISRRLFVSLVCGLCACLLAARAQSQEPKAQSAEQQLEQLRATQKELQRLMTDYDARINALEVEIAAQKAAGQPPPTHSESSAVAQSEPTSQPAGTNDPANANATALGDFAGHFETGKGFVVARGKLGELDLGIVAYARYLSQLDLEPTYTDSFGRDFSLDRRQDVVLNKVSMTMRGWLFSPDLTYNTFVWTQNSSQGLAAQVEVAGAIGYRFNDFVRLSTGVGAVPTTRSTNASYPMWVRNDNRTLADEYFRGNFSFGVWAEGKLRSDVAYKVMLANNLNQIGVDASQLDAGLSTLAAAVWWMPTTGEFGPLQGFGDYEYHDKLATMFGIHLTRSPETKQEQAGVNEFENSQIRLSDGTLFFSSNAFNTGGQINKATYHLLDLNAGFKYRGWSLEGEYYKRQLDSFETTGLIPVTQVDDHGFQLQASTMLIPKKLQLYLTHSRVYGDYGDPWDTSIGVNWYQFSRHEFRINAQASYLNRSPVGNLSIIYVVGGTGWVYNADVIIAF